jgi:hypothetical protein
MRLSAIFASQSPESYRPLPSDSLEHCLPCLFAPRHSIFRLCHQWRLSIPSIGRHGVSVNGERLVFVRVFNAFVMFNVAGTPV